MVNRRVRLELSKSMLLYNFTRILNKDLQFINILISICYGIVYKVDRSVSGEFVVSLLFNHDKRFLVFFDFLKRSMLLKFVLLYDITAVDNLIMPYRFSVYYNLLSVIFNIRLIITVPLYWDMKFPYTTGLISLNTLYKSANWLEREVWDMFGIFFYKHPDFRRILTDYGFAGFPLRKDFPVVGFYEVRYDDGKKRVVYDKIKLIQDYRVFNFINPWF